MKQLLLTIGHKIKDLCVETLQQVGFFMRDIVVQGIQSSLPPRLLMQIINFLHDINHSKSVWVHGFIVTSTSTILVVALCLSKTKAGRQKMREMVRAFLAFLAIVLSGVMLRGIFLKYGRSITSAVMAVSKVLLGDWAVFTILVFLFFFGI